MLQLSVESLPCLTPNGQPPQQDDWGLVLINYCSLLNLVLVYSKTRLAPRSVGVANSFCCFTTDGREQDSQRAPCMLATVVLGFQLSAPLASLASRLQIWLLRVMRALTLAQTNALCNIM